MCYVVFDIYVDDFKKIGYLFNFDFIEGRCLVMLLM